MRNNFEQTETLDELIPRYAANKIELDSYKKICDKENSLIKELMKEADETEHFADGYKAKYIVSKREEMNEDKLLGILKKHEITDAIKTIEIVDMDALEDYLYNHKASEELISDIDSCRSTKEVVQLRVTMVPEYKVKEAE